MAGLKSAKIKSTLAIIAIGFIGGSISPYTIKILRNDFGPFTIVFWRFFLATLFFLTVFNWKSFRLKKIKQLSFLGIFYFANIVLFSWGIKYTTGIASQLLYVLTPVLVMLGAFLLLKETITKIQIAGTIITFIGVLFFLLKSTVSDPSLVNSLGTFKGNLAIFIGIFCWSIFIIESRRYLRDIPSQEITLFSFITTSLLSLPLMIIESTTSGFFNRINLLQIVLFLVLALISSVAFLVLQQYALSQLKAFYVSFSTYLGMFFTGLTGIIFFNEKLSLYLVIGLIFISIGSFLVMVNRFKKKMLYFNR